MAEISKPDYTYLWSSGGSIVAPSNVKVQTGWTAEVPPFQWENWSQNRQDQAISHILQKGVSVWSATGEYWFTTSGERSYVQGSDGQIYVALQDSVNQDPITATAYWKVAFPTTGRLLRTSVYRNSAGVLQVSVNGAAFVTASATFTELPLTLFREAWACGGGGGGGGCAITGGGQVAAGAGGSGGGTAHNMFTSTLNGAAIVVGAGGTAASNSAGGNGGTSSLAGTLIGGGGNGGALGVASTPASVFVGGSAGGVATGGLINYQGGPAGAGFITATAISGLGGNSFFGSGAYNVSGTSAGAASTSYGGGGSGAALGPSSGTAAGGGAGMSGLVIIKEYA